MNEKKLRIFYEVSKELNMTKAAEKLYVSQPSISQAISDLEKDLGVKLFDRIGKKLYLTYEGDIFLNYTRRILNIYDEGIKVVKEMNTLKRGKLKIGASTTIGIYILPDIIGSFSKIYSNIDISLIIENTENIVKLIEENQIDIAFVEGPTHSDEIKLEKFCDDELVFITAKNHPWTKTKKILKSDIANEKMILREKGSGTREVFTTALKRKSIDYKIFMELGHTEAIKKAVEAGLGISCISKRCIKDEVNYGKLVASYIEDLRIKRKLYTINHKDKYITNVMNTFLEFAREKANIQDNERHKKLSKYPM
ncbi:LysR family transcriptional regulator [Clostridium sp. DMHC 10]|uniref:selenium metabolism-associated LysR family transcriptional regulator n=1 Tax=Clostridium sp. DMHC 10 TaxID=747377 RepID=UPI00069E87BD|nr:selenium metabolism-associated LysR family transcriptional regulator [Clostridium sp. DMHC 10]KOF57133.1 LysR family transcriptional regulator [Clostridium sp. DMHC 10]